ncbi:Uncharacterised protein [Legionella cherrii]|uniref:Uncharacterized protein n=1 Tax=Legionella cherrii TaxID=28084 RepID=A0ABY6T8G0_9GAMM|nr:Uncharacterised protein [Legionella cherrii]
MLDDTSSTICSLDEAQRDLPHPEDERDIFRSSTV